MFVSLESLGTIAIHVALLLACVGYAAFLSQPDIYKAYHPHNMFWTVVGGEVLVGIALGVACIIARTWIQEEPLIAAGFFITLQSAAAIPIWRWQHRQAKAEKASKKALETRLEERKQAQAEQAREEEECKHGD